MCCASVFWGVQREFYSCLIINYSYTSFLLPFICFVPLGQGLLFHYGTNSFPPIGHLSELRSWSAFTPCSSPKNPSMTEKEQGGGPTCCINSFSRTKAEWYGIWQRHPFPLRHLKSRIEPILVFLHCLVQWCPTSNPRDHAIQLMGPHHSRNVMAEEQWQRWAVDCAGLQGWIQCAWCHFSACGVISAHRVGSGMHRVTLQFDPANREASHLSFSLWGKKVERHWSSTMKHCSVFQPLGASRVQINCDWFD